MASRIQLITEKMTLNSIAVQKPDTWNEPTKYEAISIITALITNKNNPNVRNVTGMDMNVRIGLTNVLSSVSTIATTMADQKLVMSTPGVIQAAKYVASAVRRSCAISPIVESFLCYRIYNRYLCLKVLA